VSPARAFATPGDRVPEAIAAAVRERTTLKPTAALVLGSGLGRALEAAGELAGRTEGVEITYAELPGFPPPTVAGHAGSMWLGELGGVPSCVFRGRIHYYEGHPMALASLTARVAALLGARTIILTAATGALDPELASGALVVLRDHLNLMGANPLRGWRMPDGSPAFVDASDVYDRELAEAAVAAARAAGVPVVEGVYVAVSGPSYETPAETEAFRRLGGTVVGMSTVPEAIVARALDLRVLGLSFVANAAGISVSHQEVLDVSGRAAEDVGRVLADLLGTLGEGRM
jgi:purine-nucleoside phosphorylase